jgi:hypothetical protein
LKGASKNIRVKEGGSKDYLVQEGEQGQTLLIVNRNPIHGPPDVLLAIAEYKKELSKGKEIIQDPNQKMSLSPAPQV